MSLWLVIVSNLYPLVAGHGNMVWPPVLWDQGGKVGLSAGEHCTAGYQYSFLGDPLKLGLNCFWFSNYTHIPGKPTLDPTFRTFPKVEPEYESYIAKNPWMSPGSAPVFSPCGVVGGNPEGCPKGFPQAPGQDCDAPYGGAWSYGPKAEDVEFKDVVTTEWVAGEPALVGMGMAANHGGGYQYRLCKLGKEGRAGLTEECFQKTPLSYASDVQWVQYGWNGENRTEFRANRTNKGTSPPGSVWTKIPIPNCAGFSGGEHDIDNSCPAGLQFPAPAEGLQGEGSHSYTNYEFDFKFSLMDRVVVPADLVPGEYILSFRWDCEQPPQIWSSCASIKVVSSLDKVKDPDMDKNKNLNSWNEWLNNLIHNSLS